MLFVRSHFYITSIYMNRKSLSQEKENVNKMNRHPWMRDFILKSSEKKHRFDDNEVEEVSSDDSSFMKNQPIVD